MVGKVCRAYRSIGLECDGLHRRAERVYRVVTDCRDHRGNRILEPGPWFSSQEVADYWAQVLRLIGYHAKVEKLEGDVGAHSHTH